MNFAQRVELRSAPELAAELLAYALKRKKIRNPAAYAVSQFRRRQTGSDERTQSWLRNVGRHYAHDYDLFADEIGRACRVYNAHDVERFRQDALRFGG